MPEIFL